MNKLFFFFFIVFTAVFSGIPLHSQVDARDSFTYNAPRKIYYYLKSDDKDLIISFKIQDPLLQQKILSFGLTIWIDATNRRKEKLGIKYPRSREEGMRRLPLVDPKKISIPDKTGKEREFPSIDIIELIGFDPYRKTEVLLLKDSRIKPVMKLDSASNLVYLCTVPLQYILKNTKAKSDNNIMVSLGFVTGKMEPQPGSYGGGGEGRITHWSREQRMKSGSEKRQKEMEELSTETIFWIKDIPVAYKK